MASEHEVNFLFDLVERWGPLVDNQEVDHRMAMSILDRHVQRMCLDITVFGLEQLLRRHRTARTDYLDKIKRYA